MAVAGPSSSRRAQDLLGPFIDTLRLHQPITIPTDTLLGAITHFLSTLPNRDVFRLTTALAQSPSLWNGDTETGEIRDSLALAVESKVNKLRIRHRQSWFPSRRIARDASRWLAGFTDALSNKDLTETSAAAQMRLGLLKGLHAVDLDCTKERQELEELVVLSLAQIMATSMTDPATLDMLCEAVLCMQPDHLNVLDPKTILPLLQNALFTALDEGVDFESQSNALPKAIARLFHVISHEHHSPSDTGTPMLDFVAAFLDRAKRIEEQQRSGSIKGKATDSESKRHEVHLSAFLAPASSIVDILLSRPDSTRSSSADHLITTSIPASMIEALAAFSTFSDPDSRPADFDRVLHGSLDLLVSTHDRSAIPQLFAKLSENGDEMSSARVAVTLRCGELLVNRLDRKMVTDILLPLADRSLREKEHQESFDASHAFMLAVIKFAGDTDVRPIPQEAFAIEILPYYARLLLKHFKRDWIRTDTFTDSYLAVLEVASKVDDHLTDDLIDRLIPTDDVKDKKDHTLLSTSIAASQHVRRRRLRTHLDDVGSRIIVLPMGENRLDLVAKLFTTISQNLPDNTRAVGMTWWWEWKDRLLGRREDRMPVRAKL